MNRPNNGDIAHVEMMTEDCLNLMEGIAEAFADPGFRDVVNYRRAQIVAACEQLLDLLATDEGAPVRNAHVQDPVRGILNLISGRVQ
jgi:hypothetical protein